MSNAPFHPMHPPATPFYLAHFILGHSPAEARITANGRLQARAWEKPANGPWGWSQWETIEPTLQAVRDWLGY